jgi:ADP-heptose:LPS heptosyltransferase
LYREEADPGSPIHVVDRNLGILTALNIKDRNYTFPFELVDIAAVDEIYARLGSRNNPFVLLNPNAAWVNKCWPAESFGAVAAYIRDRHGLRTVVVWNSSSQEDEARMHLVVASSDGAAVSAPPTTLVELASVIKAGVLFISGDTGPLHIAGALGTPVVGIYGPSNPERNGPWSSQDEIVSASGGCQCLKRYPNRGAVGVVRRCENSTWCLEDVTVRDVCAAVDRSLSGVSADA